MGRGFGRLLFGVLSVLLLPPMPVPAWAQGSSAASITGTVKDTSGAVLPGVTVEAASPALIEKVRTTITDEKGEYRIIELRPGTYSITFTLPGFSVFKRDGLELGSSFTATVNVELKVGGVEETVTVSGETPLVDTQNVTQQKTLPKALLDAVPTGKGIFGFVALMPAALTPSAQQDVGGSLGDSTVRISVHGAKTSDMRQLIDGLSYNLANGDGNARGFYINPLSAQEIVIDQAGSGGSAEYAVGGAIVNLISRDGGNKFSGTVFATASTATLQSDNLTDALKAQGLTSANKTLRIYDLNGVLGGPIRQDKLWFTTSHRRSGQKSRIANLYQDANLNARVFGAPAAVWKFAPDLTKPVEPPEDNQAHNIRLTWQAAATHKVTFSYDWEWNTTAENVGNLSTGTFAWEANPGANDRCTEENLFQGTWTHPATSRLLFEGGANYLYHRQSQKRDSSPCTNATDRIMIRDVGTNFTYNGNGVDSVEWQYPSNQRFSMSYVTGSHNFKTGMVATEYIKPTYGVADRGTIPYSYTFNNGVPTQITEYVSPLITTARMKLAFGLYAQDQWKLNRLTLNLGLRYEYVNSYAPAVQEPGGLLSDPASFPEVACLPCWHDIHPRAAVVYDMFGNGKTALKASIGRYASSTQAGLVETFRPVTAAVNSTTRAWTDTNGNFFPDCDQRNPLLNGECAAMANQSFGQLQIRTRPDPDLITGWGKRGYNWLASVSVDRELMPGVAMNAGFYRNWYGNFRVTDNLAVTPTDFDPYCIPAPTDSRLPSNISGQQICGFYDITPTKFGVVDNLVTFASKFGNQTEVYNGGDISVAVRLPNRAQVSGGWNIGNSISLPATVGFVSAKGSRCFVVDSTQELYHPPSLNTSVAAFSSGCDTGNPYQSRFKVNGSYPLPWDLQAAVVYQNLPGTPYSALLTVTTAQILPSLGRNLAGGTRTITVDLLPLYSAYLDERVSQLDFRLSKIFRVGKARIQGNFDIYNLLNASTVLQLQQQYTPTNWLQPTQIMPARLLKFGVQLDF